MSATAKNISDAMRSGKETLIIGSFLALQDKRAKSQSQNMIAEKVEELISDLKKALGLLGGSVALAACLHWSESWGFSCQVGRVGL